MSELPRMRLVKPSGEEVPTTSGIPTPEKGGTEPPDNGGMSDRIIRIEERLTHIEKEVSQTKWWVAGSTLTIVIAVVATVIGTAVGIQQMTVATFQGAAQVAREAAPAPVQQPPIIINVPPAPRR